MGIKVQGVDLDLTVKIHRERIRTQSYADLGRVVWINLEVQKAQVTQRDKILLGKIDYMNAGPLIAISNDRRDLLLPFGALPFPDVPDPLWIPKMPTKRQLADASWKRPEAPPIRQSMTDRASGRYDSADGSTWVIFQPVTEIWFRLFRTPAYGVARCMPFLDTRMALMVNPETCEAFFFGGRPELH